MNYKTIEIESFYVAGISARTSENDGQSKKDISRLLSSFLEEEIIERIPNKLTYEIYCVYTDYENGSGGDYKVLWGCKVDSAENLPEGIEAVKIEGGKYRQYQSGGKTPEDIAGIWEEIRGSDAERAFKTDFDVYGSEDEDSEETNAAVYLSVK